MLPVPDGDAVVGVGGDEPGVGGVELDLHDLVARRPERPEAEHLAAAAACGGEVIAGERWVGAGAEIWSLEIWVWSKGEAVMCGELAGGGRSRRSETGPATVREGRKKEEKKKERGELDEWASSGPF